MAVHYDDHSRRALRRTLYMMLKSVIRARARALLSPGAQADEQPGGIFISGTAAAIK
jgi:hypothetical protein